MFQIVAKALRVMRREGVAGVWGRFRNSKKPCDFNQEKLKLPFQIHGTDPASINSLTACLIELLGEGVVVQQHRSGAEIFVDPTPRDLQPFGGQSVLFFTRAEVALGCLASAVSLNFHLCNAIFLPSAECIDAFVAAGLPARKLFLLDEPQGEISKGVVLRWLLFCGLVHPQSFDTDHLSGLKDISAGDQICISLPESTSRRSGFKAVGLRDFRIFDGIKQASGWQGCGWSYVSIARAALKNSAYPITICEDDMRPNEGFDARMGQVRDYLSQAEWDIFSGLLTDVADDCKISKVERRGDLTFVHLDFMTGMVLNIYGRKALERLAEWRVFRGGPEVNTIDAWLGGAGDLRVITVLPFLASHASDQTSTIFGCRNKRYDSVIAASERRLQRLVAEFEENTKPRPRRGRKPIGEAIRTA